MRGEAHINVDVNADAREVWVLCVHVRPLLIYNTNIYDSVM